VSPLRLAGYGGQAGVRIKGSTVQGSPFRVTV